MSVNRYEFEDYGTNEDDGRYVTYEDYAALEQQLVESQREFRAADATIENLQMQVEKLAAENAGLNNFIKLIKDDCLIWDDKSEEYFNAADYMPETPSTDAFLDEVRAQGVEMFARSLRGEAEITKACTFKPVQQFEDFACRSDEFAAQLRKGVQS